MSDQLLSAAVCHYPARWYSWRAHDEGVLLPAPMPPQRSCDAVDVSKSCPCRPLDVDAIGATPVRVLVLVLACCLISSRRSVVTSIQNDDSWYHRPPDCAPRSHFSLPTRTYFPPCLAARSPAPRQADARAVQTERAALSTAPSASPGAQAHRQERVARRGRKGYPARAVGVRPCTRQMARAMGNRILS